MTVHLPPFATKMDDEWSHAYMMVQIQERDAELRGQERGIAIGEKRGEKRGAQNARIENAKAMLTNGLAVEMVAKFSGLSVEQVLAVKSQLAPN